MDLTHTGAIWTLGERAEIRRTIAPDDEMYNTGPDWYFSVGESGLSCILQALACAHTPVVTSILDLPCGHGRVARYLRAAFPVASLTFSDINRSCVDFCAREFDGRGVYSQD